MTTSAAVPTTSNRSNGVRVWSALVVVYIVWGSTYIGIALMIQSIPGLTGSGIRFLSAALVMAGIVAVDQCPRSLLVSGRQFGSSALSIAALIIATIPLWVVVIRMVSGDRPRPLTFIGVGAGLVGLAVILAPGGSSQPASGPAADGSAIVAGSIALVVSSALWALGSWLSPRLPTPSNMLVYTTYQMAVAGFVLIIAGRLTGEQLDVSSVSASSWWSLLYLIVFGSLIAYTAFTWLIGNAPLSLVATYAYVNPAVAVVLGVIVFGEVISSDVIVGVLFVLGGVMLVVNGERARRHDPAAV